MDGFFAWMAEVFGEEDAEKVANVQEYARQTGEQPLSVVELSLNKSARSVGRSVRQCAQVR